MAEANEQTQNPGTKRPARIIVPIAAAAALIPVAAVLAFLFSPDMYAVTTARWTDWDAENTQNVKTAMGEEDTEERFRLYFQYYNVIHELGHGILRYNDSVNVSAVDEEQLVNDFAVAYWNYYGEPEKMDELYDIVTYAVDHIGDNAENGVDYMELAREHSSYASIDNDFFTFEEYGWFQFSSVKHSIEADKSLEEVLQDMGLENVALTEPRLLVHPVIDENESTAIFDEAVQNINDWGLKFPEAHQTFDNDPNNNYSGPSKNFLGLIKH